MTADEVRKKYIEFFKAKPRGHKEISPAPLVLSEDPTTLFTSSGMQPLVSYLMGEEHPEGKRLVNSQPTFRAVDIEEVGDNRHTTFFEMLGNWSLGEYFKEEQLPWFWEFLTKEVGLDPKRLYVTVYRGDKKLGIPKDAQSVEIWKEIFKKEGIDAKDVDFAEEKGMRGGRIIYYSGNWWSRSGLPEQMPAGEIGGPDSEVFFDFGADLKIHERSPYKKDLCHPECECGRYLEIGNSVFIQYKKEEDGSVSELSQKNVDFGGGLERIVAASNGDPDIFKIDLFAPMIAQIEEFSGVKYGVSEESDRSMRIVADHLRAACFMIAEGVRPGNKLQGYILRRLIRRSVFKLKDLGFEIAGGAISTFAKSYCDNFEIVAENWSVVKDTLNVEAVKFGKALSKGMKKLEKVLEREGDIGGKFAFDLYQTDGFPLELTLEILEEKGKKFSERDKKQFEGEFGRHKEKSRTASSGVFRGGLADHSEEVTRLHTVTHLLHASLRKVLGGHVQQKGSNITKDRLRFDFSHTEKLGDKEIKKVENLINEQIKDDLPVTFEMMTYEEAIESGAIAFFGERYGEKVKVYTIGDPGGKFFSKEVCGGPHVKRTSEIGHAKIIKQEKIGSDLVRIYAVLEKE